MTYLPPPKGQFDVEWATQNNRIIQQEISRLAPLATRVADLETGKQPLDGDLTAIAALTGTGYLKRTGSDAWTLLATVPYSELSSIPAAIDAIDGLTPAADRLAYYTGASTAALATLTSFGRSLIDDANNTAARSTLGLGTIATQAANNVAITGGTIDGTAIGATTPSTGVFSGSSIVNGFASIGTAALGASSGGGLLGLTNAHPTAADQRIGATFFGSRVGATSYYPVSLVGYSAEAWSTSSNLGSYALMQVTPVGSGTRTTVQRWDSTGTSITGTLSTTGGNGQVALFSSDSGSNDAFIRVREGAGLEDVILGSTTGSGFVGTATNTPFSLRQANIARLTIDTSGNTSITGTLSVSSTISASNLAGTTWTPTITGITNVSSSSSNAGQYARFGTTVTGSVTVSITTTSTGTTEFDLSLPVSSNFTLTADASGSGAASFFTISSAYIQANTVNDRLRVVFSASSAGAHSVHLNFAYTIK